MPNNELGILAGALKNQGLPEAYIINRLKEHLQLRILNYLYNQKSFNRKLIFTGGTCLRFCFDLPRLSEDLDFDHEGDLDAGELGRAVAQYLSGLLKTKEISCSIRGATRKIYLKLPVLEELGLFFGGSRVLYMSRKIRPNWERLKILLAGTGYETSGWPGLLEDIEKKLKDTKKSLIAGDIQYFIEDQDALRSFLSNYSEIFRQYRRAAGAKHG